MSNFSAAAVSVPPAQDVSAIEITEAGLVYRGGALLIRMRKDSEGRQDLAVGADKDRMLTILSVVHGRPISSTEALPHVESAAQYWHRGDRALANLRLVFAGLAGPSDPVAGYRASLSAYLLDQGWPPAALLEELGLGTASNDLEKYNPNHVPAGHGRRSGQFDFGSSVSRIPNGRIVVAGADNDKEFETRELVGESDPKEELEHHHPIQLTPPIPILGGALFGSEMLETLSAAARAAAAKVGPGRGPVCGTAVHTEFKNQIKALDRDDVHVEQSYLNRRRVDYGTPGSIRVDDVDGPSARPPRVYDLKTGGASLTRSRIEQIQSHLPLQESGKPIDVHEVRP